MKKFICTLISLIMSVSILSGCNLFVHNYERDYMRVIATIEPITESGVRADGTEWTYTSEKKEIRKTTLVSYVNSQGMTSINAGLSVENTVNNLMDQIVEMELLLVEADIRLEAGDIAWDMDTIEEVKKSVYTSIDADLFTIYNEILEERDEPLLTEAETSTSKTTYPLFADDYPEIEESEKVYYNGELGQYHDEWYLDTSWYIEDETKYSNRYPGYHGSIKEKSLGREAMKRLITVYTDSADRIIDITKEEKEQVKAEVKLIKKIEKEQGAEYVYPMLGRTMLIKKIYGDGFIREKKVEMLEEMITEGITASREEVTQKYNTKLDSQKMSYDNDIAAYHSAVTGDDGVTVLYNPADHYIYVKHILLSFSAEKQDELKELEKTLSPSAYERALQEAVEQTVVYEHVNGEDNTANPKTVQQVFNEVVAAMSPLAADAKQAEHKFNELIYKYNTDPGIFANDLGYAVKYKLDENEEDTYMTAFANGARDFRDNGYSVGAVLDNYVITPYGVHIMYYAGNTSKKVVGLNDYQTAGQYKTIYDIIEEEVLESKKESAITNWQDTRIYYYKTTANKVNVKTKMVKELIKQITG